MEFSVQTNMPQTVVCAHLHLPYSKVHMLNHKASIP